ncbi:MAG: DNA-nicking Smr family endonuclease [Hyphomicrobiaceae bacterium]|jgi:DNA-nicking Smr family endonuclease
MASRKKPQSKAATPKAGVNSSDSFNSPFAGLGRELGKRERKRKRAEVDAPRVSQVSEALEPPAEPAEVDEHTAYTSAMAGTSPVTGKTRVREIQKVAKSDLFSYDQIHAEDLAALRAAEGFNLSYTDGFVRGRCKSVSRETVDRLSRGEFAVREHIDLHGHCLEDARQVVDDFIREHQARGTGCVLVITGKGRNSPGQQGVLCRQVPEWLACGPSSRRVLAFVTARPCDGGEGALYVMLCGRSANKNHIDLEVGGVGTWDK